MHYTIGADSVYTKRHAGSPLRTNASLNRRCAEECYRAGMTIQQIAAEWPEVFKIVTEEGSPRLSQRYDYELADGSGRYETNRRITQESVTNAIKKHTSK